MFFTSDGVIPSGGFWIYLSLSYWINVGSIKILLSVNKISMIQTGQKIKRSDTLLWPWLFHKVLPEKPADGCDRFPKDTCLDGSEDILKDHNQRTKQYHCATSKKILEIYVWKGEWLF